MRNLLLSSILALTAQATWAEAPRVAVDIAPLHSLVAQVMNGVGTPDLILPANASPHTHSLRPSQARTLSEADVVVWIGHDLTPWMARPIEELAANARQIELLEHPQTTVLGFREDARFEPHEHDAHESEDEAHGTDPHAWLDPQNAIVWLAIIAKALGEVDPINALIYSDNAKSAQEGIQAVEDEIAARLSTAENAAFVVYHDAFHYFESRFDVEALGAIAPSDARPPSAKRLREIADMMQDTGARCVLSEPLANQKLVAAVSGDARVVQADVIGLTLPLGPKLYGQLLEGLGDAFLECIAN